MPCLFLCTTCHGPDGKGVAQGDKFLAPPLAKSEWFKRGGDVDILGRILLKGQSGHRRPPACSRPSSRWAWR